MSYELHHGDCVEVMRSLPAESVDALITSPPYAMQRKTTYGGVPEADYPAWTVAWMAEARRLLKPDGSVIINIRPHIKNGQISDYVLRTRLALRGAEWVELEELIWHKKGAPMGSIQRPRRSWESLHWFGKQAKAYSAPKAAGHMTTRLGLSGGRAGDHIGSRQFNANGNKRAGMGRVSDVIEISTRLNANSDGLNDHPAPFPWQLAEWAGKLICPPGGAILDPFSGSASTGVACIRNGWDYIGIDAVAEYVDMSRQRLEAETEKVQSARDGVFLMPKTKEPHA